MKIFTSYFYQIRFFNKNLIPLSTALWDPKWYHKGQGQSYVYKDKNGVYNGLRIDDLVPGSECHNLCNGKENCDVLNPCRCLFLKKYRDQLNKIRIDDLLNKFEDIIKVIKNYDSDVNDNDELNIVLIFHETPDNPCSERRVVQEWFLSHGIEVNEINFRKKD